MGGAHEDSEEEEDEVGGSGGDDDDDDTESRSAGIGVLPKLSPLLPPSSSSS